MTNRTLEEFYILLGRMTYCYSHLEFEVGLCLRWMVNYQDPILVNSLISGRSMVDKLGLLKQVVEYRVNQPNNQINPEFMSNFNFWISDMNNLRVKRNSYIHGLWRVCEFSDVEQPIEFNRVHWKTGGDGKVSTYDETQYMKLSELSEVVEELEVLRERFSSLRDDLFEVLRVIARTRASQ